MTEPTDDLIAPECWCYECNQNALVVIVCPSCGDKRCVHAYNHEAPCAKDAIYDHNSWVLRRSDEQTAAFSKALQAAREELRQGQLDAAAEQEEAHHEIGRANELGQQWKAKFEAAEQALAASQEKERRTREALEHIAGFVVLPLGSIRPEQSEAAKYARSVLAQDEGKRSDQQEAP